MELKCETEHDTIQQSHGFNRTFMELKLIKNLKIRQKARAF